MVVRGSGRSHSPVSDAVSEITIVWMDENMLAVGYPFLKVGTCSNTSGEGDK